MGAVKLGRVPTVEWRGLTASAHVICRSEPGQLIHRSGGNSGWSFEEKVGGTGGTGNLAGRLLCSVQEQEAVVTRAVRLMAKDVGGERERTLPRKPGATPALPQPHPFLSGWRTISPQIPVFPKQQPIDRLWNQFRGL